MSQINIWTTTTWSNVWVVLPNPSWYEFLIGFLLWTFASKYLHLTTFYNIYVTFACKEEYVHMTPISTSPTHTLELISVQNQWYWWTTSPEEKMKSIIDPTRILWCMMLFDLIFFRYIRCQCTFTFQYSRIKLALNYIPNILHLYLPRTHYNSEKSFNISAIEIWK